MEFISTHTPLAGRDHISHSCREWKRFLLTRPLRDVTTRPETAARYTHISTHTPLAGRDHRPVVTDEQVFDFYSHAPCGT